MAQENKKKPLPDNVDHWAQLKDSPYLGHWDIPVGKTWKVVIEAVDLEECTHPTTFKKEWKTVCAFKGAKKKLILNTTNMRAIASWHTNNPKTWAGKEVELFRTWTKLKGEDVECLRIVEDKQAKVRNASKNAAQALAQGG
jgi:hypothetical protein